MNYSATETSTETSLFFKEPTKPTQKKTLKNHSAWIQLWYR